MKYLDSAKIYIKSGDGGRGAVSFRREKFIEYGGPDGGNAGKGGDVYIQATANLNTLIDFRYQQHFKAQKGGNGSGKNKTGANGLDLIIPVPIGTIIYDQDKTEIIHSFQKDGEKIKILSGGIGGRGNANFKSSTNRSPKFAQPGIEGEEKWIWLELAILADIGLIGKPNAGKSSLLNALTNANSKTGNYEFTTLKPQLGVLSYYDKQIVIADLPGLIQGASLGIGLGARFLSHIKKCNVFLHVIDVTEENIHVPYEIIMEELEMSEISIKDKQYIIVLNKIDLLSKDDLDKQIKKIMEINKNNSEIICISSKDRIGIDDLCKKMYDCYTVSLNKEIISDESWHPLQKTINT